MSQTEIAKLAGTTQQAIQQAESGKARHPRYLNKLAHELGIAPEWLSMNMMPGDKTGKPKGLKEKDSKFLEEFLSLPSKEQQIIRELVKTRSKDKK